MVGGGENSRRWRLFKSLFSQKVSSFNISQMGIDIEDPSGETVHDMEENIISKYCPDPTMDGGVIAVGFSAINMSSF